MAHFYVCVNISHDSSICGNDSCESMHATIFDIHCIQLYLIFIVCIVFTMKSTIVFGTIVLIVSVAIVRSLYVIERLISMYFWYTLWRRPNVIEQLICTYVWCNRTTHLYVCVYDTTHLYVCDVFEQLISMYFWHIVWRRPNVIEQLCTYILM